jgi:hypothetical protein
MIEYYDAVLGLIPLSFLGLCGLLSGAGLPLSTAVPFAALVSAVLICHAMFMRTPGDALSDPGE